MMGIGFPELMVILVIIMIIFGAGKLPEIGSAFGRSIKNFKSSMKEAEAEELETPAETSSEDGAEPVEGAEVASEGSGAEVKEGATPTAKPEAKKPVAKKPATKTAAQKKEEELIEEAALEIKENRIGTIRTKHDGLVQQGDVFTTSLGRTPGGRGRDRGVSRDTF
jgi:sec-independent protein translocase protein TatA